MAKDKAATTTAQPFVGGLIASVAVKAIAGKLIEAGVGAAVKRAAAKSNVPLEPRDADQVAVEVATEMAKDPNMVNQMNAEPLTQSRVVIGSSSATLFGFVSATMIIWDQARRRDFDPTTLGPAIAVILGAGYALYGRLAKNLPPLWNRKKSP